MRIRLKISRVKIFFMGIVLLLTHEFIVPQAGLGQRQLLTNPADMTDLWSNQVNPAVISHQFTQFTVGTEVLHLGFDPGKAFGLSEHRFNIAFPYWLPLDLGIGLDLRTFRTSIYSEFETSLLLSRKVMHALSLGLRIGMERRSFNSSEFNLIDLDDPVLTGQGLGHSTANLGVGLLWQDKGFTFGANIDRVNSPNIARQGQSLLPRKFSAGIGYRLGPLIPTLVLNKEGDEQILGFNITADINRQAALKLRMEQGGPIRFEGQLNLSRDSKLSYGANLPTAPVSAASQGTHQLAYQQILGREPDIGKPLLTMSSNSLNITEERIKRILEAGISASQLRALPDLTQEYVDPAHQFGNMVIVPLAGVRAQIPTVNPAEPYKVLANEAIGLSRKRSNPSKVAVRVSPNHRDDAKLFKKIWHKENRHSKRRLLVGYQKPGPKADVTPFTDNLISVVESDPKLYPARVAFNIEVPGRRRLVNKWHLIVTDEGNNKVRVFSGKGNLPKIIHWDWKNDDGDYVESGVYHCKLDVLSKQENAYTSVTNFDVTLKRREVSLRFSRKPASKIQNTSAMKTRK